jgi:muramoyltetrapeptide carboxypeptidase
VCGGNLTTLCHLLGTAFKPSFDDHILFLEDRGEAPYRIDRMLTQLKLAGCLKRIKGLVLGSFTDCGSPAEVLQVIESLFRDADVPILIGVDAGHSEPNLTIPFGVPAVLDTESRMLSFETATVD